MADQSLRIDKWLWQARFCRSRVLAQQAAERGRIRLNGRRVEKASIAVRPGDVLTLPLAQEVIAVRVLKLGERRGPAREARALYQVIIEGACSRRRPVLMEPPDPRGRE